MRLHQICHDLRELDFVLQVRNTAFLVWQKGRQRVDIIVVDPSYIGIRDNYVGQVSEGSNAVGKANGKQGEGEVCGAEEGFGTERRAAMSQEGISIQSIDKKVGREATERDLLRSKDAMASKRGVRLGRCRY